jgi:DNA-binding LytR/AlgR family response regulator
VEDEHLAAEVIEDYIRQVPGLNLEATCQDVISANSVLQEKQIDLIFLDINLPGISGLEFIQSMNRDYDVILTTAYHQHAVEGFNLGVVDYLLKPIAFSRFIKAVNRVFSRKNEGQGQQKKDEETKAVHFFNTGKKQIKVEEKDILYIESLKDYIKIHTIDRPVVTKFQIGQVKQMLTEGRFLRIHKSYIINLAKMTAFSSSEIEVGDISLPIGRTYKELVEQVLDRYTGNLTK